MKSTGVIKELDGTYVMVHKHEFPTDTTELMTQFIWFTLPGSEPELNISS
jgi:hypothetical protein